MRSNYARFLCVAAWMMMGWCTSAAAQESALQVTMNDAGKFIVSGSNVATLGMQFDSPSGSLATIPVDADGVADTSPFALMLNNSPTQITIGSLNPGPVIDGSVTLAAGWNSLGYRDVTFRYGDGPREVGPFAISDSLFRGTCIDCTTPPLQPIQVGLTPENNFTISGRGHQLESFEFRSARDSLSPATTAAPFASLATNERGQIRYEQMGDSLTLDGTLTLDSGWNGVRGVRDVEFEYAVAEGQVVEQGPFRLRSSVYPPQTQWPAISARFNDEAFAVLSGTGQPLTQVRFVSPSESLIPGTDPGRFQSVMGNDREVNISAGEDSFVTIDGDLVLDTQWKFGQAGNAQDVRIEYGIAGNPTTRFSRIRDYPQEVNWPAISVELNDADQFVIRGSGHPLRRFDLTSVTGSLIPSEDLGPFDSFGVNRDTAVTYVAGENVVLDGAITLGTTWERKGSADVRYTYDLDEVSRDISLFVPRSAYPAVPVCFDGAVAEIGVSVDRRNRIVVEGDGHKLSELTLSSVGGSLVPGESASPFATFDSNTNQLVEFESDDLVTIEGTVILSTEWNSELDNDIVVDFGEIDVPDSVFPTCVTVPPGGVPGVGSARIEIIDEQVVLVTNGPLQLAGLDLQSPEGHLVPVPDPPGASPFTFFLSNTPNQITWGNLGTLTTIDGVWFSEAGYVGDSPETELQAAWGNGATPVAIPVFTGGVLDPGFPVDPPVDPPFPGNEVIPEPSGSLLLWVGILWGLAVRQGRSSHEHKTKHEKLSPHTASGHTCPWSLPAVFFLICLGGRSTVFGQQDLFVVLNEESKFVLVTPNGPVSTNGLDFLSPSGSLMPIDDRDASPFTLFLANTPHQITYGNLGSTVTFDGPFELLAGWNPIGGVRDVTFSYGIGVTGEASVPQPLGNDAYDGICSECFPVVATFDDQNRLVIGGTGQSIVDITFNSPSGSLRPGTDSGPFASVSGTRESVTFTTVGEPLSLDDRLALDARWAFQEIGATRDLTYTYRLATDEPGTSRTLSVESAAYPERSPILVGFDERAQFVLSGDGHPLTNLEFRSGSGSLRGSDDAGPFSSVSTEGDRLVRFSTDAEPVILDGNLTLNAGWRFGENGSVPDVRYEYQLADDSKTFASQIPFRTYPVEQDWPPISASVDDLDRIVLNGEGQPLVGLHLTSRSGSLLPSSNPGPFATVESDDNRSVTYTADENSVVLDGSLVLDTKWDRLGSRDIRYSYDLDQVSVDVNGTIRDYPNVPICSSGNTAALGVSVNARNQFVLSGNGTLRQLTLSSESGALVPGESSSPFAGFVSNTEQLVQFTGEELVAINGIVILSTEWNAENGSRDLKIDFGPNQLPESSFSSCVEHGVPGLGPGGVGADDGPIFAIIGEDGSISVFSTEPIHVSGIDMQSAGGHLIPVEGDAAPFTFFLSNTPNQITWGNLGSTVTLDGEWHTGAGYDGVDPISDLKLSWGDGPTPVTFSVLSTSDGDFTSPSVPEPASGLLLFCCGLTILAMRGGRT